MKKIKSKLTEKKQFASDVLGIDRKTKADYVFDKYKDLLKKDVVDIGADAMYLKPLIEDLGGSYLGVGYGEKIDYAVNLEKIPLPFDNKQFEVVLCLDVLEHIENIHRLFDELCRISQEYIIISLPNPWASFFSMLLYGDYSDTESVKFYGLPTEKPCDRHRWFFSEEEAKKFVRERAFYNGYTVIQVDAEGEDRKLGGSNLRGWIARRILKRLFRKDIVDLGLHHSTLWFLLKKSNL